MDFLDIIVAIREEMTGVYLSVDDSSLRWAAYLSSECGKVAESLLYLDEADGYGEEDRKAEKKRAKEHLINVAAIAISMLQYR